MQDGISSVPHTNRLQGAPAVETSAIDATFPAPSSSSAYEAAEVVIEFRA
jgi:hypothetical protein